MMPHEGIAGLSLRSSLRSMRLPQPTNESDNTVPGLSLLPRLLDLIAAIAPHLFHSCRGASMVVILGLAALAALAAADERLVLVVPPALPYGPAAAAALGSDAEDECL